MASRAQRKAYATMGLAKATILMIVDQKYGKRIPETVAGMKARTIGKIDHALEVWDRHETGKLSAREADDIRAIYERFVTRHMQGGFTAPALLAFTAAIISDLQQSLRDAGTEKTIRLSGAANAIAREMARWLRYYDRKADRWEDYDRAAAVARQWNATF